ncbi:alginate export family protein [Parasphingorhabdus sp.]|uniref:alginate export family protein n=1 Tax=Parasphingorhabdus sp. TaxID=2709688 RepID=UPI003A933FF9
MKRIKAEYLSGLVALVVGINVSPAIAQTEPQPKNPPQNEQPAPTSDPLPIKPYADIRYRLELVDQDGIPENATASTLRIRAGFVTDEWNGLSAVVEGEAIIAIGKERFNDTINGRTQFPIVADAEDILLNQAYIRWRPDSRIEATAGRQAVNLDNQRWVGSVGWRQNDQTLDAIKISAKPLQNISVDYFHAWRVNRIFGTDSPLGIWRDTDIHGLRAGVEIKPVGKLSGYGYWLDIPSAPALSSRTLGVRLSGDQALTKKAKLLYAAEYGSQKEYGSNPLVFNHDYWLAEAGFATGPFTAKVGLERLEGDGISALQTPLATLHAFNGWSDKFLLTPANGLRDIYADIGYKFSQDGPLKGTLLRIVYHDFNSARLGIDYGSEWDAVMSIPARKNITLIGKIARYNADLFATDTTKIWFSIDAKF